MPRKAPNQVSRLFVLPFTPHHPASSPSPGLAFLPPKWTLIPRLECSLLLLYLWLSSFTHLFNPKILTEGHLQARHSAWAEDYKHTNTLK